MLGQRVVKRNGLVGPFGLAELSVCAQGLPKRIGRVGDHAVECVKVCAQSLAAVALYPLVDHHRRRKICAEPAVFPEGLCDADGVMHNENSHLHPCAEPFIKRKRSIPDASPFTAGIEVRALDVSLTYVMAGLIAFEEMLKGAVLLFDAYFSFPHSCNLLILPGFS